MDPVTGEDLETWGPIIFFDKETYLPSQKCKMAWSSDSYGATGYSKTRMVFEDTVRAQEASALAASFCASSSILLPRRARARPPPCRPLSCADAGRVLCPAPHCGLTRVGLLPPSPPRLPARLPGWSKGGRCRALTELVFSPFPQIYLKLCKETIMQILRKYKEQPDITHHKVRRCRPLLHSRWSSC